LDRHPFSLSLAPWCYGFGSCNPQFSGKMSYYARFENINNRLFRFDTRIYLGKHDHNLPGKCVGAIIGKNPGSAKPTQLGSLSPLNLDGDKMLPSVRNRFIAAYQSMGKEIPENAFVQVWNLFYLCNPNLGEACVAISELPITPQCPSETSQPDIVWFAWGGNDARLNVFKARFTSREFTSFYYDHRAGTVIIHVPTVQDFAKHPQGMPAKPIIEHLARAL
jgi:hypothetical protein